MRWVGVWLILTVASSLGFADELHMRDGTVIVGTYVGGTEKEVYFQRTPAGADMYPVFMVESVKFSGASAPNLTPGPTAKRSTQPQPAPRLTEVVSQKLKWALALLFPPAFTAQLAHPAH